MILQTTTNYLMYAEGKKVGKTTTMAPPRDNKSKGIPYHHFFPNIRLKPDVFTAEIDVNANKLIVIRGYVTYQLHLLCLMPSFCF